MNINPTPLLLLLLCACGQSNRHETAGPVGNLAQSERDIEHAEARVLSVLAETGDATWVSWPADLRYFGGAEKPCLRVTDQSRAAAIRLLSQSSARSIDRGQYGSLTGQALPRSNGTPYLLRGFSTSNSAAHVTVTGDAVTVHSDALGGLHNIRRHPCVAMLNSAPSTVYTVIGYDL